MWRMKFKNLICDSNHSSLTLLWDIHTPEFLASLPPTACPSLMLAPACGSVSELSSASPRLSLQTFFFPGLLTWWSHTVSAVNISRLLIPNFYLTYTYKMYTTDWAVPQINMSRMDMISHPPSLALKVFLILVLSISLRHFFSFSNS